MGARSSTTSPEAGTRPPARWAVVVGVVGLLIGVGAALLVVRSAAPGCCSGSYVTLYDRPVTGVDAVLGRGDGQAFAALAQDPSLSRPHVFLGYHEAAYRSQRPMLGYLAWAGSLGSPDRVAWTIAVLEMLGCAVAAGALAMLLAARGANPWFGLAVVPAGMASLDGLTPELLALGFAAAGVTAWERRRPGWTAVWLCAAALTRETMLVVPALLVVATLVRSVPTRSGRRAVLRSLAPLGAPFMAFGVWVLVVRLRLDAWPTDGSHGRLGRPFGGLLDAASHWSSAELVWAGLAVGLVILAVVTARNDHLTWIAAAYAAFAVILGPDVWAQWRDFTRTLLPLYAFAAVATFAAVSQRTGAPNRAIGGRDALSPTSSSAASWRSRAPSSPRSPALHAGRG